jgi:NlpC/P60 family
LDDNQENWREPSACQPGGQKSFRPIRLLAFLRAVLPDARRKRELISSSRLIDPMKKLIIAVALMAPLPLSAQTGSTLAPYVSTDGSVAGTPVLLGATYSREFGWAALRLGGGIDMGTAGLAPAPEDGTTRLGVIGGDIDALLYAGSPASPDATVIPFLLVGMGMQSLQGATGSSFGASWSYGGGARMPITSWLTLDGEARYRQPLAEEMLAVPDEVGSGLEFRFGASIRTSGRRARVRVPSPTSLGRRPTLSTAAPAGSAAAARQRVAAEALDTADDYLGVHYTWGGNTPQEGFDCSGFVRYVYSRHGVHLPRVSQDQARAGEALPLDLAVFEPGDLLAFASRGNVDHIAIYAGNGRIIHSSSSGGGVRIDDLYSRRGRWYLDHMVAARRVIDPYAGWSFSAR